MTLHLPRIAVLTAIALGCARYTGPSPSFIRQELLTFDPANAAADAKRAFDSGDRRFAAVEDGYAPHVLTSSEDLYYRCFRRSFGIRVVYHINSGPDRWEQAQAYVTSYNDALAATAASLGSCSRTAA